MVVRLRALTKKCALVTAAWKELEIWYFFNSKVWGWTHCNDTNVEILGLIMYILGSCFTWRVFLKSWRAGAQPEVRVCGSCIQQPRERSGQRHRSNNVATAGIYAAITARNVGSLGTGTPHTSQKKNVPVGVDFHFTEPSSLLSMADNIVFFPAIGRISDWAVCLSKESLQDTMEPFHLPWQWVPK